MVNVSKNLSPYVFQFLPNGIIIFKELPPELYGEAGQLHAQYEKLCKEVNTVNFGPAISKENMDYIFRSAANKCAATF